MRKWDCLSNTIFNFLTFNYTLNYILNISYFYTNNIFNI
nr:MAG TPA: hypothetical protein [Crassvirales sp.]